MLDLLKGSYCSNPIILEQAQRARQDKKRPPGKGSVFVREVMDYD
jgi:hypothetical protein